jgi:hypothetical protein
MICKVCNTENLVPYPMTDYELAGPTMKKFIIILLVLGVVTIPIGIGFFKIGMALYFIFRKKENYYKCQHCESLIKIGLFGIHGVVKEGRVPSPSKIAS